MKLFLVCEDDEGNLSIQEANPAGEAIKELTEIEAIAKFLQWEEGSRRSQYTQPVVSANFLYELGVL